VAAGLLIAGETVFWAVLAAVQSNSGVAELDVPVHDGIVASRTPLATAILSAVTTVTSPLWMTVIGCALGLGWAVWKREIWRPALLVGAMAVTFAVSTLIKHDVGRGRPAARYFMLGPDDALSFPSGHTFGAAVNLFVLCYLLVASRGPRAGTQPGKRPGTQPRTLSGTRTTSVLAFTAAAAGTLVVGYSRLYLGYHWLTDVLASTGLMLAVTGIVILADGLRTAWVSRPAAEADLAAAGPSETDAHRLGDHHR
jgi:undecaprenyl-diphosphatase